MSEFPVGTRVRVKKYGEFGQEDDSRYKEQVGTVAPYRPTSPFVQVQLDSELNNPSLGTLPCFEDELEVVTDND